jgi:crossover junction endodeoxyribonuclease RuvC
MIIIGVDPGVATTGYGIVKKEGDNFICLDYGAIKTDKRESTSSRLNDISNELEELIRKHSPKFLAVESLYFFKNVKSALPVSQAKGVIMVTAEKLNIPVYEFTPLQVKMTITGYGRAEKIQVQEMVKMTLNLKEIPKPKDAADALGIAVCGIIRFENRIFLE